MSDPPPTHTQTRKNEEIFSMGHGGAIIFQLQSGMWCFYKKIAMSPNNINKSLIAFLNKKQRMKKEILKQGKNNCSGFFLRCKRSQRCSQNSRLT